MWHMELIYYSEGKSVILPHKKGKRSKGKIGKVAPKTAMLTKFDVDTNVVNEYERRELLHDNIQKIEAKSKNQGMETVEIPRTLTKGITTQDFANIDYNLYEGRYSRNINRKRDENLWEEQYGEK